MMMETSAPSSSEHPFIGCTDPALNVSCAVAPVAASAMAAMVRISFLMVVGG